MKTIAFVPVRKGSKSIPNKNIKSFAGKPLVYWMLLALSDSKAIDEIYLSTDGDEIANLVESFKLPKVNIYHRSAENATDEASTESAMLEFINEANIDLNTNFVLAQATSPLTQAIHVDEAMALLKESGADSLLTVVRTKRFFWNEQGQPVNYNYKERPRRQDFDGLLMENGAFYISTINDILASKNRISGKIVSYEMPENTALEIDEEIDWQIGEKLMASGRSSEFDVNNIKLVLSDVDGVLTDAGMYYTENGDEIKKFSTYDGMAFRVLKENGVKVGIVTGEDRELNRRRAEKLKLDFQYHGISNKLEIVIKLCEELNISLSEVAYIGDDINDMEVLQSVGISSAPASAPAYIKDLVSFVCKKKGGEGVFREFVEKILGIDKFNLDHFAQ